MLGLGLELGFIAKYGLSYLRCNGAKVVRRLAWRK